MDDKIEQSVSYKFCVNLGKSATETLEMLREAFWRTLFKPDSGFRMVFTFKACRGSVEDDKRSGRPSTSKTTENAEKFKIVHSEFVPPNTTVNSDFYCDVVRRLRESVLRKRPQPQLASSLQRARPHVPEPQNL
jgi:hypothetical protein